MSFHSNASLGARHPIHNWEYANAAARTGATGFVAADIGKIALQLDTLTLHALTAIAPTWDEITPAGGPPSGAAGGDLNGSYPNPGVDDGADATAIHDNLVGEIAAITAKATPVAADLLIIEDSADSNAKKSIQIGNLPGGGGGSGDVVGPASAVDLNLAAFDGTSGKLIKDSGLRMLIACCVFGAKSDGTGNFLIANGKSTDGDDSTKPKTRQPIVIDGTLTRLAYKTKDGDTSTQMKVHINGVVEATVVLSSMNANSAGVETISVSVSAGDYVEIEYDAAQKPGECTMYFLQEVS